MQENFQFSEFEPDGFVAARTDWSLDQHTREVGRQGIAAAREILAARSTMATAA